MPKAPKSETVSASLSFATLCEMGLTCERTCTEIRGDELVAMSEPRTAKECADLALSLLLYNDETLSRDIIAAQCPVEGEYMNIQATTAAEGAQIDA